MQISLLLMQQIAQLFLVLLMGYAVVKTGLLKASDSKVLSVVFVYLVMPCVVRGGIVGIIAALDRKSTRLNSSHPK